MTSVFEFVVGILSMAAAIFMAREARTMIREQRHPSEAQNKAIGSTIGFCLMGFAVGVFFILLAFGAVHIPASAQPTLVP